MNHRDHILDGSFCHLVSEHLRPGGYQDGDNLLWWNADPLNLEAPVRVELDHHSRVVHPVEVRCRRGCRVWGFVLR